MEKEQEKQEPENKRSSPGTGEQYLLALIRCADWVTKPYKHLAEQYKQYTEFVKELYLCSCDGVPVEAVMDVLETADVTTETAVQALGRVRMQHMSGQNDSRELADMKKKALRLEKEVREMSVLLGHIADKAQTFDMLFPDTPFFEESGSVPEAPPFEDAGNVPKSGTKKEEADVPKSGTKKEGTDVPDSGAQTNMETEPDSGIQKNGKRWLSPWKKERKKQERAIPEYVEELLKDGYSSEQIAFILDCIEDGMDIADIKKFASKKLPVNLLRRLKQMEMQKGRK